MSSSNNTPPPPPKNNDKYHPSIQTFLKKQRELLSIELNAEIIDENEEDLHETKNRDRIRSHLHNLEISDISLGLYGRTVVTFCHSSQKLLKSHKFKVGDEIEILSKKKGVGGGVICLVSESQISAALFSNRRRRRNLDKKEEGEEDENLGELSPPLTLIPRSSAEVHRKMLSSLSDLEKHGIDHPLAGNVIQTAFNESGTTPSTSTSTEKRIEPINPNLDDSQKEAIEFALFGTLPITLIHGPPGTGKTTTLAEFIHQSIQLYDNAKILVTAPSNVAVDNLLEKLISSPYFDTGKKQRSSMKKRKLKVVRLGHPARISPKILKYSLESMVQNSEEMEIIQDVQTELKSALIQSSKIYSKNKREIATLRKEIKTRQESLVKDILKHSNVVLCTNVGASSHLLNEIPFDLSLIDEAAQALEASCWIPILKSKRVVLAGDHCQLPPTILSTEAKRGGLDLTLFDRVISSYNSKMLKVQYRMHADISDWASGALYHDELQCAEKVKGWVLGDLPHFTSAEYGPLLLVDTTGCGEDYDEVVSSTSLSYCNHGEARVVQCHVENLLEKGLRQEDLAIITPYNGQVENLRGLLLERYPKLEIRSVDGFQGGEREAVVLSLVRSNANRDIGFLGDERRLNVAITRAKRHCAVICNVETVEHNKFIKGLIQWMEDKGEYRSAMEFVPLEKQKTMNEDMVKRITAQVMGAATSSKVGSKEEKMNLKTDQKEKAMDKQGMGTVPSLQQTDNGCVEENHQNNSIVDSISKVNIKECSSEKEDELSNSSKDADTMKENVCKFSTLEEDNPSDDSDKEMNETPPNTNALLKNLAKERLERKQQQQQQKPSCPIPPPPPAKKTASKKTNNKKKKNKGGKNNSNHPTISKEEMEMDDMAFLDAQIHKVQTSHDQTVQGSGSNYRSIMNGILISKPLPPETKKDGKASSALKAKLKKAEDDRKVKSKNKKKK